MKQSRTARRACDPSAARRRLHAAVGTRLVSDSNIFAALMRGVIASALAGRLQHAYSCSHCSVCSQDHGQCELLAWYHFPTVFVWASSGYCGEHLAGCSGDCQLVPAPDRRLA
jgi:hypothetical protein